MSIPSFLTSGASSRAHHALIVALNDSKSDREEGEVIAGEVGRIKMALGKGVSSAKVAEKLIILLHCDMVPTEIQLTKSESESDGTAACGEGMDWALLAALKVAEGGKTLGERRIGYLYLCERLPPNHELALLWINTIRKDLSSTNPHDTLLALNAIISHPSPDLLPAVSPLLITKGLLRHQSAMVRQKVVTALGELYLSPASKGEVDLSRTIGREGFGDSSRDGRKGAFPLGMSKVVRLVDKETDVGVASALVRLLKGLIEEGYHTVQDDKERTFLLETVIAQAKRSEAGPTIVRDVLDAVRVLVRPEAESSEIVEAWIVSLLKVNQRANPAILLDICLLVAVLSPASQTRLQLPLIKPIEALLRPAPPQSSASSSMSSSPSTSRSAALTTPLANDHVLALRCLSVLPSRLWDTALGEDGMRIIMEGLHSPDDTIRLGTLRLLNVLSPDLLYATLQNCIQNIINSSDLALPLGLGDGISLEEKLRLGVEETGLRALEVVRVRFETCLEPGKRAGEGVGVGGGGEEGAAGKVLAEGMRHVLCAVGEARGGFRGGGDGGNGKDSGVWEAGVRLVLDLVGNATPTTRQAFVHALLDGVTSGDSTLAVILATTAADYGIYDVTSGSKAITVLLGGVGKHSSSVQELLLIAATGIASRLPDDAHGAIRQGIEVALSGARNGASGYMRKRCDQIDLIIHDPTLLRRLAAESNSQSITDYLQSIIDIARSVQQSNSAPLDQSRSERETTESSRSLGSSALRYDAYDTPGQSASSVSRSTRPPNGQERSAGSSRSLEHDHERVSRSGERSYASRSASRSRRGEEGVLAGARIGTGISPAAGEYTLFSADEEEESNDHSTLLDDEERVDNLVGLSLGMRTGSDGRYGLGRGRGQGGGSSGARVSDPFGEDEDEDEENEGDGPLTPRLR